MENIATIIGSLGFPIVACCGLGVYVFKIQTELVKSIQKSNELLAALIEKLDRKEE